jgi:hypothetical protein
VFVLVSYVREKKVEVISNTNYSIQIAKLLTFQFRYFTTATGTGEKTAGNGGGILRIKYQHYQFLQKKKR